MSHKLTSHNSVLDWEIEIAEEDTAANAPEIRALDQALRNWRLETELDVVEFSTTAELVFTFEVKHKDSRVIVGVWDFTEDRQNPTVTIDAPDPWKITELLRLDIRDAIVEAVKNLGMSSMIVEFQYPPPVV